MYASSSPTAIWGLKLVYTTESFWAVVGKIKSTQYHVLCMSILGQIHTHT